MAGEKQKEVIERLAVSQQQLLSVPDDQLALYMQVVGDTYAPIFFELFGAKALKVHSLSSFVVRQAEELVIKFGELHHIGEAISLGVHVSRLEQSRIIYIELEAESIATPPGNDEDFNPFYEVVKLPVAAIENIRAA